MTKTWDKVARARNAYHRLTTIMTYWHVFRKLGLRDCLFLTFHSYVHGSHEQCCPLLVIVASLSKFASKLEWKKKLYKPSAKMSI